MYCLWKPRFLYLYNICTRYVYVYIVIYSLLAFCLSCLLSSRHDWLVKLCPIPYVLGCCVCVDFFRCVCFLLDLTGDLNDVQFLLCLAVVCCGGFVSCVCSLLDLIGDPNDVQFLWYLVVVLVWVSEHIYMLHVYIYIRERVV